MLNLAIVSSKDWANFKAALPLCLLSFVILTRFLTSGFPIQEQL